MPIAMIKRMLFIGLFHNYISPFGSFDYKVIKTFALSKIYKV